jgi:hypothetical protein
MGSRRDLWNVETVLGCRDREIGLRTLGLRYSLRVEELNHALGHVRRTPSGDRKEAQEDVSPRVELTSHRRGGTRLEDGDPRQVLEPLGLLLAPDRLHHVVEVVVAGDGSEGRFVWKLAGVGELKGDVAAGHLLRHPKGVLGHADLHAILVRSRRGSPVGVTVSPSARGQCEHTQRGDRACIAANPHETNLGPRRHSPRLYQRRKAPRDTLFVHVRPRKTTPELAQNGVACYLSR